MERVVRNTVLRVEAPVAVSVKKGDTGSVAADVTTGCLVWHSPAVYPLAVWLVLCGDE